MGSRDFRIAGVGARDWRMSGPAGGSEAAAHGLIYDVTQGIVNKLAARVTPIPVIVGFPDERVAGESDRAYPCVSVSLVGKFSDLPSRYGGIGYVRQDNPDGKTADLRKPPIPVQLVFQIDTLATTQLTDWSLTELVLPLIEAKATITTAAGRMIFMTMMTETDLDGLEEGLWRKAYRVGVTVWFEHPDDPVLGYLVQELHITLGSETITVTE